MHDKYVASILTCFLSKYIYIYIQKKKYIYIMISTSQNRFQTLDQLYPLPRLGYLSLPRLHGLGVEGLFEIADSDTSQAPVIDVVEELHHVFPQLLENFEFIGFFLKRFL